MAPETHDFLTLKEVCSLLRISMRQGLKLIETGDMPPCVLVGSRRRYPRRLIDKWVEARLTQKCAAA